MKVDNVHSQDVSRSSALILEFPQEAGVLLPYEVHNMKCEDFLPNVGQLADLVVTSPPYNLGKEYEDTRAFESFLAWQRKCINLVSSACKPNASLCYQIGNYVENGHIEPLDYHLHQAFVDLGWKLRNRIVWRFGHGHHLKRRFSGRYEVVLWYTRSEEYVFNLDAVRVPVKYPGKRSYRGPSKGKVSSNPLGKNPEDVWDIPHVKGCHVEKYDHPCQFPVGLVERLVLALTRPGDLVLDPFMGVGSSGVASLVHGRTYVGCEPVERYFKLAVGRLDRALLNEEPFRPHNKPIMDARNSPLSRYPSANS